MTWLLTLLVLTWACVSSDQNQVNTFNFASYYKDHMVLQRAPQHANIWGYAATSDIGQLVKVTVSSSDKENSYMARVQPGPAIGMATWRVKLLAYESSSESYSITASLGSYLPLTLSDVLFGDVWVCSGQSNMVFKVSEMFNNSEEYALATHFPDIRLLLISDVLSYQPLYDIKEYIQTWSLPSQDTLENFSAVCWLYARHVYAVRKVPMGMIVSAWGGTPIEAWSSPEALDQCGLKGENVPPPSAHHVLWNAMIHPLLNMTIYGALWYQGEANANRDRDLYNCTFPAMISDWREKWERGSEGETNPVFPFGFVQLGPNELGPVTQGFSDIRWHQTRDVGFVPNPLMKNVFMAVAMDLTDTQSPFMPVHYRDKGTVGQRLTLSGLSVAYGVPGLRYQGPWPTEAKVDMHRKLLNIVYDNGQHLIDVRNKKGFEVCCNHNQTDCSLSGKDWIATDIIASGNTSVTFDLTSCSGLYLTGIRYNWLETPCPYKLCAVYSVENQLPAPPFIKRSMQTAGLLPHETWSPILITV